MLKYTDKQKLEAVEAYRKATGRLLAPAKAQGVHVDSLHKWVAGHSARGAAGVVTKKRSNYDLNIKLEMRRDAVHVVVTWPAALVSERVASCENCCGDQDRCLLVGCQTVGHAIGH